jgi:putative phosphoesterase
MILSEKSATFRDHALVVKRDLIVGVISDTHGLLRPQAVEALRGSEIIIHAGDVGDAAILESLRQLAPTFAVRGNIDHGDCAALPATELVEIGEFLFFVLHDIGELDLDPPTAGFAAVVCGHSHRPSIETRDGVLYLNPGSAGPRRFKLPVTVARVRVSGRELRPEIVMLTV